DAYAEWLRRLRTVCSARGIVLILDEVFMGFRLAPGGAQEYFGVRADMVTYGKTLGGGLPVGVLCGSAALMRRYRDDHPADICFARGTFNTHPYVMGAMHAFLERLERPEVQALYDGQDERFDRWSRQLNAMLDQAGVPARVAHMASVWTVLYAGSSRYNWMLQFYLRAHGVALSWVGSGRMILGLNWTDGDFEDLAGRFVAAALQMQADGWWWQAPGQTDRGIRRGILGRALRSAWRRLVHGA
ncbi:MAG: aminotransferase class III-fold pyridoxal phosphate-dependent enzyme, partial [Aquabacterium sp.]